MTFLYNIRRLNIKLPCMELSLSSNYYVLKWLTLNGSVNWCPGRRGTLTGILVLLLFILTVFSVCFFKL